MDVVLELEEIALRGILNIPENPKGLIIFAHGSGSSRLSSRNQFVAKQLEDRGFATLLFDLLTEEEDQVRDMRFDIPLLAKRLILVTTWCKQNKQLANLPLGYFGASTGAAAALIAASQEKEIIQAVVSRGGRPDLAGEALALVKASTLLIVGGDDTEVIELNEIAKKKLQCESQLVIIPHATHLFEEEGALEQVADEASKWFAKYTDSSSRIGF